MLERIRKHYSLRSPHVLSALEKVPREAFLPSSMQDLAFADAAAPIGHGQTISQPYTVAFMTDLLDLQGHETVLELGTGSGYQAAVLSHLARKVYTIERLKPLAQAAKQTLKRLGYRNVFVKHGQGELGWPHHAPYDAILVTADISRQIPSALLAQLNPDHGVLVAPVNGVMIRLTTHGSFRFVPFVEK